MFVEVDSTGALLRPMPDEQFKVSCRGRACRRQHAHLCPAVVLLGAAREPCSSRDVDGRGIPEAEGRGIVRTHYKIHQKRVVTAGRWMRQLRKQAADGGATDSRRPPERQFRPSKWLDVP